MTVNLKSQLKIIRATLDDYPTIQNMSRFYAYDMSRSCGFLAEDWAFPANGLYECHDFKRYFDDPTRQAFLIKIEEELAGFVLLHKEGLQPNVDWCMGEFCILAKFQGKGLGAHVAQELWTTHKGSWELTIIPENKPALVFWRKTISRFTSGNYQEQIKSIDYDTHQPQRYVLNFNTSAVSMANDSNAIKIHFINELDEATSERMTAGFVTYEKKHGIDVNYKPFSVVITNEQDKVFGAITAYTAFSEIYIDNIWVDSDYRDKGYGRKLLEAVEAHFKGQGFNNINLVTSAFQAPEFYKKCGYTEEHLRINKLNPKLSKSFFVKFFDDEKQTQGLIQD